MKIIKLFLFLTGCLVDPTFPKSPQLDQDSLKLAEFRSYLSPGKESQWGDTQAFLYANYADINRNFEIAEFLLGLSSKVGALETSQTAA